MAPTEADYIIVGGGLTGCVVASRLKQSDKSLGVLLIEAGPDSSDDPRVTNPMAGFALGHSELDWAYTTVPQAHLKDRTFYSPAGKTLGGGSVLNYGGWSRGEATDYDEWARIVEDSRWSYQGLLPFFKKSEHYHDPNADPYYHGFEGPMHYFSVSASDAERRYPLREPLRKLWSESGVMENVDPNRGSLTGVSELEENWKHGLRQPSHRTYSLTGVEILNDKMVQRIVLSDNNAGRLKAIGIQLADGNQVFARKEVILTAGAYRTPQLLMLSGIGPENELANYSIPVKVNLPEVGRNSIDHFSLFQFWRLRDPSLKFVMGSPPWTSPAFSKGLPCDWVVREPLPTSVLTALIAESANDKDAEAVLQSSRSHLETMVLYLPAGADLVGLELPQDGMYVASSLMLLLPTSRGRVSLASASVADPPSIDPLYYNTVADRGTLIHGVRRLTQTLLDTPAGSAIFETEVAPPGMHPLTKSSTDEEIDERIRSVGVAHAHTVGTAAMGKVVDTHLRVFGVEGLRVADASVLPVPLNGHPQATLYAVAEQAAEIILKY